MCLRVNDKATKEFLENDADWRIDSQGRKYIMAYKVYNVDVKNKTFISPYYGTVAKPGWIKSDRETKEIGKDIEDKRHSEGNLTYINLNRGIHVILDEDRKSVV